MEEEDTNEDQVIERNETILFLIDIALEEQLQLKILKRIKEIAVQKMVIHPRIYFSIHLSNADMMSNKPEISLRNFTKPNRTFLSAIEYINVATSQDSCILTAMEDALLSFKQMPIQCWMQKILFFPSKTAKFSSSLESILQNLQIMQVFVETFPLSGTKPFFNEMAKYSKCQNHQLALIFEQNEHFNIEYWIDVMCRKSGFLREVPFFFHKNYAVNVELHSLFQEFHKSRVYIKNNEILKKQFKFNCDVERDDLMNFIEVNGSKITFSNKELDKIRTFSKTGLYLIGFASTDILNCINIRKSFFICPLKDSQKLISCLIQRLILLKKVALCKFISISSTHPRLVALLPQSHKYSTENGMNIQSDGFHLIHLPYAEDLRDLSKLNTCPNSDSNITKRFFDIIEHNKVETKTMNHPNAKVFQDWILNNISNSISLAMSLMTSSFSLQTSPIRNFSAIVHSSYNKKYSGILILHENEQLLFNLQPSSSIDNYHSAIIDSSVAKLYKLDNLFSIECQFLEESNFPIVKYARVKPNSQHDYELFQDNYDLIQRIFISQISVCKLNQQFIIWLSKSVRVHFIFEDIGATNNKCGRMHINTLIEVCPVEDKVKESMRAEFVCKICPDLHFDFVTGVFANGIFVESTPIAIIKVTGDDLSEYLDHKDCNSNIPTATKLFYANTENLSLPRIGVPFSFAKNNHFYNGCLVKIEENKRRIPVIEEPLYTNINYFSNALMDMLQCKNFNSMLISSSTGTGKTSILKDFYMNSPFKCVFIDDLKSIQSHLNENVIFLYDNLSDEFIKNEQFATYSLKKTFNFEHGTPSCKVIATWNTDSKAIPQIVTYLFDFNYSLKNPPLDELQKIFCSNYSLIEKFQNKPISIIQKYLNHTIDTEQGKTCMDIVGYNEVKSILDENILWPIQFQRLYNESKLRCKSCIILYGPSGCGKSAIATNYIPSILSNLHVIKVKGPELLGKYIGSSEEAIRRLFSEAKKKTPSLIIFDEFDSLAGKRGSDHSGAADRVVNQLLTEIDGVEELNGVFIIATTSRLECIDPALLRPGRIDTKIHIGYPTFADRVLLLSSACQKLSLARINSEMIQSIAEASSNVSCADLEMLCVELAMNENMRISDVFQKILEIQTLNSQSHSIHAVGSVFAMK